MGWGGGSRKRRKMKRWRGGGRRWTMARWNEIWIKMKEDGKWVGMGGAGLGSSSVSHWSTVTESWRICRGGSATGESGLLHLSQSWCSAVQLVWRTLRRLPFAAFRDDWMSILADDTHTGPSHYQCDNFQTTESFRWHRTCLLLLAFFIYATCCAALLVLLPFSTRRQISVSENMPGTTIKNK